jgi:hypothetical protein
VIRHNSNPLHLQQVGRRRQTKKERKKKRTKERHKGRKKLATKIITVRSAYIRCFNYLLQITNQGYVVEKCSEGRGSVREFPCREWENAKTRSIARLWIRNRTNQESDIRCR